ncbi:histidine--tRNA ligase [Plasmodiophora brassicae]|uniref:histidine--tRNA ligase n=1 Tax=Plasmodiophora brassicae TaxID=37360 RepID=A0A3P3Y3K4_PLABS|nr:unnamed protein product [Plasmodiophora brassicae]
MATVRAARGFRDALAVDGAALMNVEAGFRTLVQLYGFKPVYLPVCERRSLFDRANGDTVASKELFALDATMDEEQLVLRPEGTAGALRASLHHGGDRIAEVNKRIMYCGPMFRHERPQAGRFRQFSQFGVEHLNETSPLADAELIEMAHRCLVFLGVRDHVTLKINCLGCPAARSSFSEALTEYLRPIAGELSERSQERLERGHVMRILDSNDKHDIAALRDAPRLESFIGEASRASFNRILNILHLLDIQHEYDHRLVRGLDYYGDTTFEFVAKDRHDCLGKQQMTLLAGGRYNELSLAIGWRNAVPAVGWAAGLERIVLLQSAIDPKIVAPVSKPEVAVVVLSSHGENLAMAICRNLRTESLTVVQRFEHTSAQSMFRWASKVGAQVAIVIGEDEIRDCRVKIKDLTTQRQEDVKFDLISVTVVEMLCKINAGDLGKHLKLGSAGA